MKRRICFVIGVLARTGGTERVCTNIANALSDRYDVTILSTWDGGKPGFLVNDRVQIDYLMKLIDGKIYHFFPSYFTYKYVRYIRNKGFDVVIDVDICLAQYSIPATRGTHTKVIDWEQFNYWYNANNPDLAKIQRLVEQESARIVVLTRQDYDYYHHDGRVPASRLAQIYNTSPLIGAKSSPRDHHLAVAVGRLTEQKGFDILLNAWAIVEQENSGWKLAIIGSGEDEAKLKGQAKSLNLKRVSFIPATDDIESWYDRAGCFLLSSRYEGFVMVLLEAMAKGLPPVAFDCVAGPREIIKNGVNGFLVPMEGGAEAFARKTLELLSSPNLQDMFSAKARERAQDFDISVIRSQWISLIEQVLNE